MTLYWLATLTAFLFTWADGFDVAAVALLIALLAGVFVAWLVRCLV